MNEEPSGKVFNVQNAALKQRNVNVMNILAPTDAIVMRRANNKPFISEKKENDTAVQFLERRKESSS